MEPGPESKHGNCFRTCVISFVSHISSESIDIEFEDVRNFLDNLGPHLVTKDPDATTAGFERIALQKGDNEIPVEVCPEVAQYSVTHPGLLAWKENTLKPLVQSTLWFAAVTDCTAQACCRHFGLAQLTKKVRRNHLLQRSPNRLSKTMHLVKVCGENAAYELTAHSGMGHGEECFLCL